MMENPLFAVVGDSHLIADTDRQRRVSMYDSLYALQQVVDYVQEKGIPLILAGDLFDKNLVQSRLLRRAVKILEPVGEWLYGIQGNHDKDRETPWFMHVQGAKWLRPGENHLIGSETVQGIDFAPSQIIQQQLQNDVIKSDHLILHQALKQGLGFEGAWNLDLNAVTCSPNVWLGDLHKVSDELFNDTKSIRAVYTMSQYQQHVDESCNPSFLVVYPKDPSKTFSAWERIPLKARPFFDYTIDSPEALQVAMAQAQNAIVESQRDTSLPEEIRRPGFHVTYFKDVEEVSSAFRELTKDGELGTVTEKALPSRNTPLAVRVLHREQESVSLGGLVSDRTEDGSKIQTLMFNLLSCKNKADVHTAVQATKVEIGAA